MKYDMKDDIAMFFGFLSPFWLMCAVIAKDNLDDPSPKIGLAFGLLTIYSLVAMFARMVNSLET